MFHTLNLNQQQENVKENKEGKIRYLWLQELASFQTHAWVALYKFLFVNKMRPMHHFQKILSVIEHLYLSSIKKI